jgi:hypothetical protein
MALFLALFAACAGPDAQGADDSGGSGDDTAAAEPVSVECGYEEVDPGASDPDHFWGGNVMPEDIAAPHRIETECYQPRYDDGSSDDAGWSAGGSGVVRTDEDGSVWIRVCEDSPAYTACRITIYP